MRRSFIWLEILALTCTSAACGAGGQDSPVISGTSGDGGTGSDTGSIGDGASSGAGDAGDALSSSSSSSSGADGSAVADTNVADGGSTVADTTASSSSGSDVTSSSSSGSDASSSSSSSGSSGADAGWPAGPEDDIKAAPDDKAKYKTCSSLWGCTIQACSNTPTKDCMNVCLGAANEAVLTEMTDFVKCYTHVCHEQDCKSGDKQCLGDCIWKRCAGFAMKCNADKASGAKTCDSGFTCFDTCKGSSTIECMTKCYKDLTKSAQHDFDALWFCVAKSDAKEPYADCIGEALVCASGGTTGKNTCLEISVCDGQCEKDAKGDKFPCTAKCFGAGDAKAQGDYIKLMDCVIAAQSAGGNAAATCGGSVADCAGSKPDGTAGAIGCQDIAKCESACKQAAGGADESCSMKCLAKATKTEAMKWWHLAMCYGACNTKCSNGSDSACVQACVASDCKKQQDACLGL